MGLGKDEQGCPTMRQFADFAAQFADFVVTLQKIHERYANGIMWNWITLCS